MPFWCRFFSFYTNLTRISTSSLCRHVFEDLYSITIVQSVVRMHLSINDAVDRLSSIIAIQSWWRGIKARDAIEEMDYSAVAIQSNWRRYLAQMSYQFDIIDIIIVQSVARRWQTRRDLASIRIQCLARVMFAKARFREKSAMQTLVTRHTSAAKIQSCWRSYTAQVHMLISIVNVIVIQVSKVEMARVWKSVTHCTANDRLIHIVDTHSFRICFYRVSGDAGLL